MTIANIPIFLNIYNGVLSLLFIPNSGFIKNNFEILPPELISRININILKNKTNLIIYSYPDRFIYPYDKIGQLADVWKFVGYFNNITKKIILNNLLKEEISIHYFNIRYQSIWKRIENNLQEFKTTDLAKQLPDDAINIIDKYTSNYSQILSLTEYI